MSSVVVSDISAEDVAFSYIAEHYPALDIDHISALKLGSNWLVSVEVSGGADGDPQDRVVMVVNRHGFVDEAASPAVTRHNVHRCLADLRDANGALDLR